jgi:hypothetical protein
MLIWPMFWPSKIKTLLKVIVLQRSEPDDTEPNVPVDTHSHGCLHFQSPGRKSHRETAIEAPQKKLLPWVKATVRTYVPDGSLPRWLQCCLQLQASRAPQESRAIWIHSVCWPYRAVSPDCSSFKVLPGDVCSYFTCTVGSVMEIITCADKGGNKWKTMKQKHPSKCFYGHTGWFPSGAKAGTETALPGPVPGDVSSILGHVDCAELVHTDCFWGDRSP